MDSLPRSSVASQCVALLPPTGGSMNRTTLEVFLFETRDSTNDHEAPGSHRTCLLYTSDAADDL